MIDDHHERMMQRALDLAARGRGFVSPNPMVGAVIVKKGKIIGEGYHKKFGGPHAEVEAFNNVVENCQGADLYVTLEPCCHKNKKTPPCLDLILSKKIKKIYISSPDSNSQVSGQSISALKEAGLDVHVGILAEKERKLNERFHYFMQTGLPFIHLKWAQTIDGFIARKNFQSKWITNENSRRRAHLLRLENDAIMIGKNTLIHDNPSLDIRYDIEHRIDPFKIIIAGTPPKLGLNLLKNNRTIIVSDKANWPTDLEVINVKKKSDQFLFEPILRSLANKNISSILVEGGSHLFQALIEQKLVNKVSIFIGSQRFGEGIRPVKKPLDLFKEDRITYDDQTYIEGYLRPQNFKV